jgi:hypothetical protein
LADSNVSSGKVTAFIGIASSVLTIALTVFNTYTKARIDAADEELKQRTADLDIKIRQQSADLDQSRDRTALYALVHSLFPELSRDPKKPRAYSQSDSALPHGRRSRKAISRVFYRR